MIMYDKLFGGVTVHTRITTHPFHSFQLLVNIKNIKKSVCWLKNLNRARL